MRNPARLAEMNAHGNENTVTLNKDGTVVDKSTFWTYFKVVAKAMWHGPGSSENIGSGSKDGGSTILQDSTEIESPSPAAVLGIGRTVRAELRLHLLHELKMAGTRQVDKGTSSCAKGC